VKGVQLKVRLRHNKPCLEFTFPIKEALDEYGTGFRDQAG